MKKTIIILALLAGSVMLVTAYGRDGNESGRKNEYQTEKSYESTGERQRLNLVAPEECQLENDDVGTGYLNNENRKHKNQSEKGMGRNRQLNN